MATSLPFVITVVIAQFNMTDALRYRPREGHQPPSHQPTLESPPEHPTGNYVRTGQLEPWVSEWVLLEKSCWGKCEFFTSAVPEFSQTVSSPPGIYNDNDSGSYDPSIYIPGAPYSLPGLPVRSCQAIHRE